MLHDMVHPQEHLPIDDISSPLGAQLFDFCESELFPETLQNNSEVASSSNCYNEEQSSYPIHLSDITADMNQYNNTIDQNEIQPVISGPTTPPVTSCQDENNMSAIMFDPTDDQLDNDIAASIDFSIPASFTMPHHQYMNNQESFNINALNNQLSLADMADGTLNAASLQYDRMHQMGPVSMLGSQMHTGYDADDCSLPSVPSYIHMRTSVDPMIASYLPSGGMNAFSTENSGFFSGGGLMIGNGFSNQELDFQGDNGLFLPDTMPRAFASDLQALSSESQHLVHGGGGSNLGSEMSSLEDPSFKMGKLSVEERKRKIHRYMKKRNERNFSKKIKYACRKTLADSRPRVRGRFAKNDEQGDMIRTTGSNHEYDTDEDVSLYSNPMPDHQRKIGGKEEEDMDSADIFAHISGVNSFKCSYPIQSWI